MQLFIVFVVALSITAALIPFLARWAPRVGLTDAPGPRKVHSEPVPRIGGIAMAVGILVPALSMLELNAALGGMFVGLAVLLAFGVWDDRVNASYWSKFIGQFTAVALCMEIGDVRIDVLTLGTLSLPPGFSWALTFVFLVGVTNAVNLSDGLDGLAGGMALLCLVAIALLAAASGNGLITSVALIEAGAIVGFLRFNAHPARVFMGDAGSQVLGFTMGVLAILATQGETATASAALPLLLIGVPIVDTFGVMARRILEGRSPFSSDRNHLHHKLLYLGFGHGKAVIVIYALQAMLFLIAYFLRFESDLLVLAIFCAFSFAVLGTLRWAGRSGWRAQSEAPANADAQRTRGWLALRTSPPHMQQLALGAMGFGLVAYIAMTVANSGRVGNDVGILCFALLAALLIVISVVRSESSRTWADRVAAYVGVAIVVYLDQTAPVKSALVVSIAWTLLAVTGAAALVRFFFSPARRFEVTSLDVLVVFIAVVLPHLPSSLPLPADLPAGITKAVILLYVVEALLGLELKRAVPRAALALTLGIIAARWLVAPIV